MSMSTPTVADESTYVFEQGYPTVETARMAYDEADLNRAIQAYRFFYPTVSGIAIVKGNQDIGVEANRRFGIIDTKPHQLIFTANSDTPYGPILLDLRAGPMVVELPAGPLLVVAMDVNQRWVADMGLPGPDAGNGGKHLIVPPGYTGEVPDGYHVWRSSTNLVIVGVRSLPLGGDVPAALARIRAVQVHPLNPPNGWQAPTWVDATELAQDTTPLRWETNLTFWRVLHDVLDAEPAYAGYRNEYGELAVLGIAKGKPFAPDARMRDILERAARVANAQMRVESFADRRPDRVAWPDRRWEWAALRFENGDFAAATYTDLDARDKWFYQAIGASPAMFRRTPGAGSLYWLGLRDTSGAYLNGDHAYRLVVPRPVPARLFWSVTVYDAETRSEIQTEQGKAALRSLFELKDAPEGDGRGPTPIAPIELYFGPNVPAGKAGQWIRTVPGKGWFAYFRVYGPEAPAFDGTWKPGDFQALK